MANISQVQVGNTTYDIADATARNAIANFQSNVLIPVDYSSSGFSQFTNGAIGIGGTDMDGQPTFITKAPAGSYYGYYRFCLTTTGNLRVDGCLGTGGTWTTIGYVQLNDTATVKSDTGERYQEQFKTKSPTSLNAAMPDTATENDYTNGWECYDSANNRIGYTHVANTKTAVYRSFAVYNPRTQKTAAIYLNARDNGTQELTTNSIEGSGYVKWSTNAIPDLPATKITSGQFGVAQIPPLPATKITSGQLGVDRIPPLSGAKITSGTVATARLTNLFTFKSFKSSTFTINSGEAAQVSVNMTLSGWDCIAIVGIQTAHSTACSITEFQTSTNGKSVSVRLRNHSSSKFTDCWVQVRGLYTKTNLYTNND